MFILKKYTQILPARQVKRLTVILFACVLMHKADLLPMDNNGRGTKGIGMANAFVAVSDNCWAVNYNPAGLTKITGVQCSAFFVPEQFGLPELKTTAFAAAASLSCASIGMSAEKFGFDLYSETEIALALAKKIDRTISAGICIEYNRIDIARYGTAGCCVVHGGLKTDVGDRVSVGFVAHNISGAFLGKSGEKLPQVFDLGTCWTPCVELQISIDIEKDIRFPASVKLGLEQILFSVIALRAGIGDNPDTYSLGLGVWYSIFEFGYAGYSHPDLGWTHQVDLTFKIDK